MSEASLGNGSPSPLKDTAGELEKLNPPAPFPPLPSPFLRGKTADAGAFFCTGDGKGKVKEQIILIL